MMKCKFCEENIIYKNGRWQHLYLRSHIISHDAIPNEYKPDPFMHCK